MKKLFIVSLFVLIGIEGSSQQSKNWAISYGINNFINFNHNIDGKNYLDYNTVEYPNSLSIEKNLVKNFSLKFNVYTNQFENHVNAITSAKNKTDLFYGVDVNLKYDLSDGYGKNNWLNPYFIGGLGYSRFDVLGDAKFTVGLGTNLWLNSNFGIQVNSAYNKNFQLKNSDYLTSHLGIVIKFDKMLEKKLLVDEEKKADLDSMKIVDVEKKIIKKDIKKKVSDDNIYDKTNKKIDKKNKVQIAENKVLQKNKKDRDELETKTVEKKVIAKNEIEEKTLTENFNKSIEEKNVSSPTLDTDGDKVPDEFDKCPMVFGTIANNGCPEKAIEINPNSVSNKKEVDVNIEEKPNENINILKVTNVYFEIDGAVIADLEKSKIHMIMYIMDKNPNSKIIIEGHTEKDTETDYSEKLSASRANIVKQYLIKKGVDEKRIETKSIGNTQPVTDKVNDKTKGPNRRAKIILMN